MSSRTKICYVLCYRDPDYVRSLVLIQALKKIKGADVLVVKNRYRGVLRYIEVPLRLLLVRLSHKPDVFFVGFRGHEVFWLLYPTMLGKKIIFDEFINLHDWLVSEHKKLDEGSLAIRLIDAYTRWVMRKSDLVLSDTQSQIKLTSEIYGIPMSRLAAVPVGTDESVFYPRKVTKGKDTFDVFFYGSMLPLHGKQVMLDTFSLLQKEGWPERLRVKMVGGKEGEFDDYIQANRLRGKLIHRRWVEFGQLPIEAAKANVTLGGPFGDTGQAQRVITGKAYQFLAVGAPVIVGRIKDAAGLLEDKKNCILVDQGSPRALADAIRWAHQNPSELTKIGARGRRLYEEMFSIAVISRQLSALLDSLVEPKSLHD